MPARGGLLLLKAVVESGIVLHTHGIKNIRPDDERTISDEIQGLAARDWQRHANGGAALPHSDISAMHRCAASYFSWQNCLILDNHGPPAGLTQFEFDVAAMGIRLKAKEPDGK
ncbi:hypothetical protein KY495_13240 [Massilia sp. PAMC28688]|uniref:hypothetical protein n=1 Tax=Massilia sp. PAMC28688 TaxID=2861283 RepID=UPI001C636C96|nr:hypothetical protein [Massilia sp. PAMC28688]QYF91762.1 hypothetical protein KY495_13240 [Massilia sp. PAMC28688]